MNNFDLKLLTASKEVGLRRLRSYSASLGGGAQIFNSYEDLRRHLETTFRDCARSVVLHDGSVPLTAVQLGELQKLARVFAAHRPAEASGQLVPLASAPCWGLESYMQCTLGAILDSPVVRMSMAQLCKSREPFHLENLLRWGHASQTWQAGGSTTVADASFAFVRSLNLTGEGRRLTEMFSHFLQVGLGKLNLQKEAVTFGSDGLLTLVVARCRPTAKLSIRDLAHELRVQDLQVAIANGLPDGSYEIAGLYYPFQHQQIMAERIVMVFHKQQIAAEGVLPLIDKAG